MSHRRRKNEVPPPLRRYARGKRVFVRQSRHGGMDDVDPEAVVLLMLARISHGSAGEIWRHLAQLVETKTDRLMIRKLFPGEDQTVRGILADLKRKGRVRVVGQNGALNIWAPV